MAMRAVAIALAFLLSACTSAPPLGPPATGAPDLRGSWAGSWGGTPFALLVTEQTIGPGESAVMLGPWQLFGERYPTVAGVMTCTIRGERVSTHADGVLSESGGGGLVLTLRARSAAGDQRVTLRLIGADRLQGSGDSQYRWGPQGPAELGRLR
jgi:hypothetical protein